MTHFISGISFKNQRYFVLAFILMLVISGCKSRTQSKTTEAAPVLEEVEGWTHLFDGQSLGKWEETNFGPQGPVYVSRGNIILEMGDAITGIHWTGDFPKINYEVLVEASKVVGNDFFCTMTFPVGDNFCSLIVGGWSGMVVGLSTVDGEDASENETHVLHKFERDTWYNVRLRVTETKIEAWVDDEQLVDLNTEGRELTIRPEMDLSRPFGITSWRTTAAIKRIMLKEL